jgi:hypothetical protein
MLKRFEFLFRAVNLLTLDWGVHDGICPLGGELLLLLDLKYVPQGILS